MTEKTQTLQVSSKRPLNPERKKARWSDWKEFYELDSARDYKLSKRTKASICPSSYEKEKVFLVLNVFSDYTVSALLSSL